ncbi:MAG TPA: thioredoxin [Anditalea sp.]|nr:thioredoxin [Anditalea sp.]
MQNTSKPKSFHDLISGDRPVLVDFYATWCGPCKTMQPILEDVSRQLGDQVKVIKVDVDKNPDAANKYQVRGVPTLILFKKGQSLWRQSGVVPAHQLINVVKQHAK